MRLTTTSLPVFPTARTGEVGLLAALEVELRESIRGQVRFGAHDRALYSTDASPYQVMPLGVVVPTDAADVATVLRLCAARRVPVLPRGGGTSLAGQCTNRAVVVDLSAMCRRLLSVDAGAHLCDVEAGIGVDELNRQLARVAPGLLYAPDPATVAQATIGGCIGNNAAGSRSVQYGRTSENVAGVDVLLATGQRLWLTAGAGRTDATARRLAVGVSDVVARHADLIRQRFARTLRRNAGYGLDLVLKQLDAGITPDDLDLSGLICGSEGTLAVVLGARLKLHPVRNASGLAIASFGTLEAAMDAVNPILTTKPTAVELLDDAVLRAAVGNDTCRPYVELLPRATGGAAPQAVLYVEYQADTEVEIEVAFERLTTTLPGVTIQRYGDKGQMDKVWMLRKSGEALLHGLPGNRKPQTFVEDNAVPPENLPRFVKGFKEIVARHGTEAAYYAHASVGVLHVRPMIDLHDPRDRDIMQRIAVEVADLARACGGVMSGEHGDGRVRGPLLERFYGPELMNAFAEVKAIFDPLGILNPGMIVGAGKIDTITQNLRVLAEADHDQDHQGGDEKTSHRGTIDTYYDYADQDTFGHAVDMCNGAGFCRKSAGGTMCPSYRGTLDERHSTRGRGNALRQAIRVGLGDGEPAWNDVETLATLDLCLSCKACKSECPSNVDVARLKAEYLAQSWRARGGPTLKALVFGHVRRLNQLGSIAPALANFVSNLSPVRGLMNRLLHIAPKRSLPAFSTSLHRWFRTHHRQAVAGGEQGERPKVIFYADCFATYNEPHIGRAAVKVLEACGYEVVLPSVACCGRAMISTGLLTDAITSADHALATLSEAIADDAVKAIVVAEPSCLSAITDDWLQLKLATPMDVRRQVAARAMLVEDFVDRFWDQHPNRPTMKAGGAPVVLHGHCHQKAVGGGEETSARLLRRLTGGNLTIIPSGCCGMAGSFGYDAGKYELSMAIGELSLFPPLRAAPPDATICAPGTSCRHQIHDGTGRHAVHPIELAASMIAEV
jgi:FAD/FMN-containing dehydrogenase/Fe-S oxidoreductase